MKNLGTKLLGLVFAAAMVISLLPQVPVNANTLACKCGGTLTPHAPVVATCDKYGSRPFFSCNSCHKCFFDLDGQYEIKDQSWVAVAPTGHTIVATPAVAATCTTDGVTATVTCSVCKVAFSAAQYVPAFGHQYAVTNIKTAHPKGHGSITETCSICGGQKVTKIQKPASVELSKTKYTYDGSAKKPKVTVYDSDDNIIPKSEYTVSYSNNKKVGTAKVTIKFKGNHYYSGKMTAKFKIVK